MRRRTLLAGVGIAATGALAGCTDSLLGSDATESFSQEYDVSGETTVAVGNRNGDVTVQESGEDALVVSGEKRASSQSGLDSTTVDVTEGEEFVVDVSFEPGSDFSNRRVDLTVEVPEGVEVERVETVNGAVTVEDVRGDLEAVTTNGSVEVTDVSGYVRGESSNGGVEIRGTTGLAGARTDNGEVDVDLLSMRDDVTCRSSNGSVTVRVGDGVSAELSLSTGNGAVEVRNLPYSATTQRRRVLEGSLRGGGSRELTARTGNGNVTLRPA